MISQLHCRILTYDTRRIDNTWGTLDHCDPYWRLYVNKSSGACLELPGEVYRITPNRVHLIPAWVTLRCRSSRALDHFYVHFDLIGLSGPAVREVFPQPICLQAAMKYEEIVGQMVDAETGDESMALANALYVKSLIVGAIHEVFRAMPQAQRYRLYQLTSGGHSFADLVEHIDRHLNERLDNQALAQRSNMSKSHFIRSFHEAVGQTPAAFVAERRIAAAAERLSFTDDSIEAVAAATGFSNRFYFSRAFSRAMGIPPASYRSAAL